MDIDPDVIGRLAAALILGFVVGLERAVSDQPAGLRTHITVCLGACLFGIISTLGFDEFLTSPREENNVQIDVTRVASQVVVGIGFLGAGMIFRQGAEVKNLTTAASLWVTSAIGLAAGVGDIATAGLTTAAVLIGLILLRPIRNWIRRYLARDTRHLHIRLANGSDPAPLMTALHDLDGVTLHSTSIEKDDSDYVLVVEMSAGPAINLNRKLHDVVMRDDVVSLRDR